MVMTSHLTVLRYKSNGKMWRNNSALRPQQFYAYLKPKFDLLPFWKLFNIWFNSSLGTFDTPILKYFDIHVTEIATIFKFFRMLQEKQGNLRILRLKINYEFS